MLYPEDDNLVNEIDRFLCDNKSNTTEIIPRTVSSNASVEVVNCYDNINTSVQLSTSTTYSNEVEYIGENRATFEILEDHECGVYEYDPYQFNWNVFYKPLSPEQHTVNIKQEPGLKIKKEIEENPINSFSFIREYENLEKSKLSYTTQNIHNEFLKPVESELTEINEQILVENSRSPPPFIFINNNEYSNTNNNHDYFKSNEIYTGKSYYNQLQVSKPFVENVSSQNSRTESKFLPEENLSTHIPIFHRVNGFSLQMKKPLIDTSIHPPWNTMRVKKITPVNHIPLMTKQNSLLNKHAKHSRKVPHLMSSIKPQILKHLPVDCQKNNWPRLIVSSPKIFKNSNQCNTLLVTSNQTKQNSLKERSYPGDYSINGVNEIFDQNKIIANAMIKDYLSPVSLVGSTIKFESRKLANTGVREELEKAFKMHGTISNSWWTPDDMLYVTFTARNVAKQVYSLYPVNNCSSY